MNNETKIQCYHGTSKRNQESIKENGFEESKPQKGHWLGRGIYFYKNIYYAIEWNIINYIKKGDSYIDFTIKSAIIEATLNFEKFELLDLNDPIGYSYYLAIIENIKEKFPEKIKKIERNGDIEIIRFLEELEEKTGEQYISMFDVLIADYPKDIYNKGNKNIKGNFLPCIQKQICVKNKDVIEKLEMINLNNKEIRDYFNIIKKNREVYKNEKQHRIIRKISKENKRNT